MRYNLTKRSGLNFGKGKRALLQSFVPKNKTPDYYHKIRRQLGYVFTPVSSDSEPEKWVRYDHSLGTLSWESDVSVGALFKNLSVNMVSTSHMEDKDKDEAEEMIQSDADF